MNANYLFAFAFGIGVVAGLRSLTAPAVVAWAARSGWLDLSGTPFAFVAAPASVAILSLLALGELVADLLPAIPKRTALAPLLVRILSGAFCGACLFASAKQVLVIGAIAGAIGAVAGAFGGYEVRRRLVTQLRIPDLFVALSEDVIALGLAWLVVSR